MHKVRGQPSPVAGLLPSGSMECDRPVPTLFRLFATLAVIGGVIYGVLFALANFVEPQPREITVTIPQSRLVLKPVVPANALSSAETAK